jgi:hypothetical protein
MTTKSNGLPLEFPDLFFAVFMASSSLIRFGSRQALLLRILLEARIVLRQPGTVRGCGLADEQLRLVEDASRE